MQVSDLAPPLLAGEDGDRGQKIWSGMSGILARLREFLKAADIQLPPRQQVLDAVGGAYDSYIKPIDIPYVPEVAELVVDKVLRGVLVGQAGKIYDELEGVRVG